MLVTMIFGLVAAVGFGLALLLAFRVQKNLFGHPSRLLLCLFIGFYLFGSIYNVLHHGGLADFLHRFDYLIELLFPPLFLFFLFPIFALYIFSTFMKHDMYRRIQAETALRESEARYRGLFEYALDGFCLIRKGRIMAVNSSLLAMCGCANAEEFSSVPLIERIDTEDRERFITFIRKIGDIGVAHLIDEFRFRGCGGHLYHLETYASRVTQEEPDFFQICFHNITERKDAELALQRAKEEWERTFDTVPDLITILDSEQRILRINKAMEDKLGVDPTTVVGHDFHEVVHGDMVPVSEELTDRAVYDDRIQMAEIHEIRDDSYYLVTISILRDAAKQLIGFVRVARDVSELKRIEKELERTQAFLHSVIDGVTDTIMVIDKDYRVLHMNRSVTDRHAVPQPLPSWMRCHHISHHQDTPCDGDDHPCPLRLVREEGKPITVVHKHLRHDGSDCLTEIAAAPFFDDKGQVAGIIELGRDITEKTRIEEEKKRLEARIFQQQKDQSIANLASGMAHDFNNLLATVSGNVELLQMNEDMVADDQKMLVTIMNATQKMVALTNQLLAYAKEGAYQSRTIEPHELMAAALEIALTATTAEGQGRPSDGRARDGESPADGQGRPSDGRARDGESPATGIRIDNHLPTNLWQIRADPNQMRQMLANLLINAFEALSPGGGVVTISAENHAAKEEWECAMNALHPAGDYVHLQIADTGPGFAPEVAVRLFEPFVSTKAFGRGLGMPAALGIAHNHGGCITLQDRPDKGVTCHIYLPRDQEGAIFQNGGRLTSVQGQVAFCNGS